MDRDLVQKLLKPEILDLIDDGRFIEVYDELTGYVEHNKLTEALLEIGVDLSTMKAVPVDMYRGLDIEEVVIPEGVTILEDGAFCDCNLLKNVRLPSTLEQISDNVFRRCSSLVHIDIPKSVKRIGAGAFGECTSLVDVDVSHVPSISSNAFMYCDSLVTIKIGAKVLRESVLGNCNSLEVVEVSKDCAVIRDEAFVYDHSLKEVTSLDSIEQIRSKAFHNCDQLERLTLGNKLKTIYSYAFMGTRKLLAITYRGTKQQWRDVSKEQNWRAESSIGVIHCSDGDVRYR